MKQPSFVYMLRRTLPLWKWETIAKETIAHCQQAGIEEIIWMIDPEDFTHGLPSLSFIEEYLPVLRTIKEWQAPYEIRFSINPWVTLGHIERGRDASKIHPKMNFMVDQHGYQAKAIACPLSEEWQHWIAEAYARYASLSPHILWLEDDFRLFNHETLTFGCFCEQHLDYFESLCGKRYTRQALLEILLAPGKPHIHREQWLAMNAEILEQAMKNIEQAVHRVSPTTQLGLMCSSPEPHAAEGRRWDGLMQAMCGESQQTPVARPSMGSYNEFETQDVLEGLDGARITAANLPSNTLLCPELESCFYSTFAKSARHTALQTGLAALTGAAHLTMNLYDFIGGSIPQDDPFMNALKNVKPKLDALVPVTRQINQPVEQSQSTGNVKIEFLSRGAKDTQLLPTADSLHQLAPKTTGWSQALQSCGIPVSFEEGSVQAITGQYFYSKSEEEIQHLLSKNLLLDGSAADTLQQMGYGTALGVTVEGMFHQNDRALGAEKFHNETFGGAPEHYMTLITTTRYGMFAQLTPEAKTKTISSITDPDRNRLWPCMTAYENSYGGRIIVYAADLSHGFSQGLKTCFLNPLRVKQLGGAVRWLSGTEFGVQNVSGAYHIPFAGRCVEYLYLGLANLSTDHCSSLVLRLWNSRPPTAVQMLKSQGWGNVSFQWDGEVLQIEEPLGYKDFSALKIYFT